MKYSDKREELNIAIYHLRQAAQCIEAALGVPKPDPLPIPSKDENAA